jgi:hypothetical protein
MRFRYLALSFLIFGTTAVSAETLTWDAAVAETAKDRKSVV